MKKFSVYLSPNADYAFQNILALLDLKAPKKSEKVKREVLEGLRFLESFPEGFERYQAYYRNLEFNIRSFVVEDFRIIYEVQEQKVLVLDVISTNLDGNPH